MQQQQEDNNAERFTSQNHVNVGSGGERDNGGAHADAVAGVGDAGLGRQEVLDRDVRWRVSHFTFNLRSRLIR